ncbi:D-2-hydroxyacid dehydrogenase [Psychromonas sp. KJ10-10]|uniref:D-2-hydroxyacid dehydrogenase n=1 Tax=Psychromonas sp. KJ10-10 TaxID=3391823 RepID=UPI0039B4D364
MREFTQYDVTEPEQTLSHIGDNEIILTNKVMIDEAVMLANPQLKLICITATGTNNVDLVATEKAGIMVKNVAGYSTESVAQATIAMLLQLTQHSRYYDEYTLTGQWTTNPTFTHIDKGFSELKGKKWGIIGFGAIGQRVAEIASVFGCELCYFSTSGKNSQQAIEQVDLETLLSTCDFITIHAPLNDNTANLIDKFAISKLKPGAIILNLGRGGIIDEDAMAEALDEQDIYHGTDVLAIEPMIENHPYLQIKNKERLVITPHTAWASKEARDCLIEKVVGNIKDSF